jgi:hypothetical protein
MPSRKTSRIHVTLLAAILLFIVVGALLPAEIRRVLVGRFPRRLHVDLIGHAVGFGAMAFLLANFGYLRTRQIILLALALAIATEVAQLFIPGRTALISDVVVDVAGAAMGLLLARRWARRQARSGQGSAT